MEWTTIDSKKLFNEIVNGKDIFIADPDKGTCQWVNAMSVQDLIATAANENVVLFCKKDPVPERVQDILTTNKRIDPARFTFKLREQNMSQRDLAKISGVSGATIQKFVHMGGCPKQRTLNAICKALNCIEDDILED